MMAWSGSSESEKWGGRAFPYTVADPATGAVEYSQGMTLRDWLAGQALAGMLAFDGYVVPIAETRPTSEVFAHSAYEIADAMLAARST